jgi:hypothetical protein
MVDQNGEETIIFDILITITYFSVVQTTVPIRVNQCRKKAS